MSQTIEPSIRELRDESERTREALVTTVGELRERVTDTATEIKTMVSPSHIKQEIKDYVRNERESLTQSLRRRAKDNPLQMAAVGAALAYPAWGLLRVIPMPLMLIGAGLFLTSKRGQDKAQEIQAKAETALRDGAERVADFTGSVRSDIEDRIAGARYAVEEVRDAVVESAGSAAETVASAVRRQTQTVSAGTDAGVEKGRMAVGNMAAAAGETIQSIQQRVGRTATRSRSAVVDFVNDNPLLVAGLGAAIGAFIAASLPPSEAENRLLGAGSDKLKEQAREAVAQGVEKAGDVAAGAVGAVASAAAREGLDATGVRRALNTVADSVRAVADRGLDTALGNAPSSDSRSKGMRHE